MDLLTVNRGEKGFVNSLVDFVGHAVGSGLCVVHILAVFFAQIQIAVVGHQLFKSTRCLDDAVGVLVEHFKKITFSRQQFAK